MIEAEAWVAVAFVLFLCLLVYVGAQFLMDLVPPNNIDSDLDPTLQWTVSLQAGVNMQPRS